MLNITLDASFLLNLPDADFEKLQARILALAPAAPARLPAITPSRPLQAGNLEKYGPYEIALKQFTGRGMRLPAGVDREAEAKRRLEGIQRGTITTGEVGEGPNEGVTFDEPINFCWQSEDSDDTETTDED